MFNWKKKKTGSQAIAVVRDDRVTEQTISRDEEREECFIYEITHMGTREYQQDASCISHGEHSFSFAIICDGMGGMAAGEEASRFATAQLSTSISTLECMDDIPSMLLEAVQHMNQEIQARWLPGETGSTLVSVVVWENQLFWISVGDSRIYILRGEEMVQVTRDHNYGMELDIMVMQEKITEQEAREDVQREALVSYLGAPRLNFIDQNGKAFLLEEGDIILLCSDGLTKVLADAEIKEILQMSGDARDKANALMNQVMIPDGTSRDNTTIIVIVYPLNQRDENKKKGEQAYEISEMQ